MSRFLKTWSLILLTLNALSILCVDGVYFVSTQDSQVSSISTDGNANISGSSQDENISSIMARGSDMEHRGDCGDRHLDHHSCHLGHCSYTTVSASDIEELIGSDFLVFFSLHSMVGVELVGPRKPPRA